MPITVRRVVSGIRRKRRELRMGIVEEIFGVGRWHEEWMAETDEKCGR
jgi:hypothetical protein